MYVHEYISGVFLETNESYPFCGNVSLPWHKLLKFHKCTAKHRHNLEMEICAKKCKFRCKQFTYVYSVYFLSYLHLALIKPFLCKSFKSLILRSLIYLFGPRTI